MTRMGRVADRLGSGVKRELQVDRMDSKADSLLSLGTGCGFRALLSSRNTVSDRIQMNRTKLIGAVRVYGLVSWPQRTDTHGELVRKYCPELKGFPDKVRTDLWTFGLTERHQYIYEPHKAPVSVQKEAKCMIGQDYPAPMLDEHIEKDRCIQRLKNAFALGFHGDSPEVLDGTAKKMLEAKHEETGVNKETSMKGRADEKAAEKRKRSGNTSLDGFVKRKKD